MSTDLKADLLRDALSPPPNGDPEWLRQLRARLERATVTEPAAKPAPPTITFAEWCERQGIQRRKSFHLSEEGDRRWWGELLDRTGWTGWNRLPGTPLTICDLARAVLALPDGADHDPLPGCRSFWADSKVWSAPLGFINDGKCRSRHDEARAVLAHFGEPVPGERDTAVERSEFSLSRIVCALERRVAALEADNTKRAAALRLLAGEGGK